MANCSFDSYIMRQLFPSSTKLFIEQERKQKIQMLILLKTVSFSWNAIRGSKIYLRQLASFLAKFSILLPSK